MQNKGTIVRIVLVALMAYALLHFAAARAELEQTRQLAGALAAEREAAFVTLFYGEGVSQEEAEAAQALFTEACPETEISLLSGGQPVYYYTISIE